MDRDIISTKTSSINIGQLNGTSSYKSAQGLSLVEIIFYSSLAGCIVIITVVGNLLVLTSFVVERQLRSISNYFLMSLAVADLMIGLVSMPLYTVFLVVGHWPLPYYICDLWLSIDYTMSNASVANLLIISIDRYYSVTRPLTYRIKRTSRKVVTWIGIAWLISALMWTPLIYIWPIIDGQRKVAPNDCFIQFIESNSLLTLLTACLAYFIPVTIISILYYRIYQETNIRRKLLSTMQGLPNNSIHQSSSGSRTPKLNHTNFRQNPFRVLVRKFNSFKSLSSGERNNSNYSSTRHGLRPNSLAGLSTQTSINQEQDITKWEYEMSVSLNRLRYSKSQSLDSNSSVPQPISTDQCENNDNMIYKCYSNHQNNSTNIPEEVKVRPNRVDSPLRQLSLKSNRKKAPQSDSFNNLIITNPNAKEFGNKPSRSNVGVILSHGVVSQKSENKAAKTLSAILLAFIITWTPYNIFTVINAFYENEDKPIGKTIYSMGYWLCYLNSTVNPLLYALCNITFRKTFFAILSCSISRLRSTQIKY